MEATLKFSLPEEESEYRFATEGFQYYNALDDIRDYLRQKIKYAELNEFEYKSFNDMYDKFFEILNDNKINLE